MRTLQEITDAVRRNEHATSDELRYAIAAYDVFLAKIEIEKYVPLLTEFFIAAESSPRKYIGPENDPKNKKVAEWHRAVINVKDD